MSKGGVEGLREERGRLRSEGGRRRREGGVEGVREGEEEIHVERSSI